MPVEKFFYSSLFEILISILLHLIIFIDISVLISSVEKPIPALLQRNEKQ